MASWQYTNILCHRYALPPRIKQIRTLRITHRILAVVLCHRPNTCVTTSSDCPSIGVTRLKRRIRNALREVHIAKTLFRDAVDEKRACKRTLFITSQVLICAIPISGKSPQANVICRLSCLYGICTIGIRKCKVCIIAGCGTRLVCMKIPCTTNISKIFANGTTF